MKQQTAVEWYYDQTVVYGKTNYAELLEQAKQMEKEQIIDSYNKYQSYLIEKLLIEERTQKGSIMHKTYNGKSKTFEEWIETYGSGVPASDISVWKDVTTPRISAIEPLRSVSKDIADYIDRHIIESMKELAIKGFKPQTPEISDEEIEKAAAHHEPVVTRRAWISACKWYREQLKNK